MDERRMVKISKYLAKHLRHDPQRLGLTLAPGGWVDVDVLLEATNSRGMAFTRDELDEVVARNDKQRYAFDATGTKIRASQGHSTDVDLELRPAEPPELLFHGTATRFLDVILAEGLRPMRRQHVHLSKELDTARTVGARHGKPVVLQVDAAGMTAEGHHFWVSDNGVWLTTAVPPAFLSLDQQP